MRRRMPLGSRWAPRTAVFVGAAAVGVVLVQAAPWADGSLHVRLSKGHVDTTTTTTTSPSTTTTSTTVDLATTTTALGVTAKGPRSTTTTTAPRSTTTTSAPSGSTTTTVPKGGCADPSGQCLPATPSGYTPVCQDDFTVNAPMGSWGTSDASAVVYTGDHGCRWVEYPDGWSSTYTNGQPGYEPAQVLSVHDGMLDFYLHNVNGLPAGANPSPILANTGTQYQTYGMYSERMRITGSMPDFYIAHLLWPQNDANWQSAESDFPEANLSDSQVCFYAHFGGSGSQDSNCRSIDFTQWHTYTQVWAPGQRSYYLDGQLLGTSTNQVWNQGERWQLQTEPSGQNDGDSGHLLVDWVAVYAPG